MRIKPHTAIFLVIVFISGLLVGHYLPVWDTILPELKGPIPSFTQALTEIMSGIETADSEEASSDKAIISEEDDDDDDDVASKLINKVLHVKKEKFEKSGHEGFFETPVLVMDVVTGRVLKIKNQQDKIILVYLKSVQDNPELIDGLKKYLVGQKLWLLPAMKHSDNTKALLVYAYLIPRTWKENMGTPSTAQKYSLNRLIYDEYNKKKEK